ncbi:MAG TPA: hypothetical protein VNY05_16920 [Candidatus Acidoferrales bacterium]|jgi:hypothetical protein|nr:hypothetical protein [Candidatus Acidoferrales bacterium]
MMRPSLRPAFFLAFSVAVLAQTPAIPVRAALDFKTIPRPPVPADALELVTGSAQPVQDAQQRIAAIALLNKARDLSNVRAQPYDLKTSFFTSGGLASDGAWVLEDIARGRGYRWTAQGPNYSSINLYPDSIANGLYGNQPSGILPLRVMQVRAAIFFTYPMVGTQASLRTATGFLNGAEQRCVLMVIGAGNRSFTGGRNWEESEYCVDAQTGLLTTYSPVPGLFVHYDYSSAIRFHNKSIPTGFTITEAGQMVAEARTLGVTDPPASTDAIFNPAGLTAVGAGRAMNPGFNRPVVMPVPGRPFPDSNANAAIQVVTLHGNVSGDGRLSEVEILASSDTTLNQAALDRANALTQTRVQGQPGATAQSSELILTFEFVTPAR